MTTIEIDGQKFTASPDKSIIEVADEAGIPIPRFCYHKKLSIAANCRMCLVEVEKSRKPLPACATPISDGMKVYTRSKMAIDAQKIVMEFLLINHPLDCPICDQGGECELQDVSMGYGADVSRFNEGKRVVDDEDLGSLIATDMTRCIHCTRCVRFGEEVSGLKELGSTGRGEDTKIKTCLKGGMRSEISGNVIDICPVGALTSKPFQYRARAWELNQFSSIAPHDCIGSNIYVHTRRNEVMRVIPKENESVNETWLSDRDRFSYEGLSSDKRVSNPLIKENGAWKSVSWDVALNTVANVLKEMPESDRKAQLAGLISPSATVEECYLLQKLVRGLGSHNIDHRIRNCDSKDKSLGFVKGARALAYQELESEEAILLIGSNLQSEQPLAGVRVRKANLLGAKIYTLNPVDYELQVEVSEKIIKGGNDFVHELAGILKALGGDYPKEVSSLLQNTNPTEQALTIAAALKEHKRVTLILGAFSQNHPESGLITAIAAMISKSANTALFVLSQGANSLGAATAGAIPYALPGLQKSDTEGLSAFDAIQAKLKTYLIFGFEPEMDMQNPDVVFNTLRDVNNVIMFGAFRSELMLDYADIILPISLFSETSGTFVNVDNTWQSFNGCTKAYESSRPGWKILRVLGNLCGLNDFNYESTQDILEELKNVITDNAPEFSFDWPKSLPEIKESLFAMTTWTSYGIDSLVRRADSLLSSAAHVKMGAKLNSNTARKLGVTDDDTINIKQPEHNMNLGVQIDEAVSDKTIEIINHTHKLMYNSMSFGYVEAEKG